MREDYVMENGTRNNVVWKVSDKGSQFQNEFITYFTKQSFAETLLIEDRERRVLKLFPFFLCLSKVNSVVKHTVRRTVIITYHTASKNFYQQFIAPLHCVMCVNL